MRGIVTEIRQTVPQVEGGDEEGPEMFVPDPDYADLDDEQVEALAAKVGREARRRNAMADAQRSSARAVAAYRAAAGITDGMEWSEPTGYLGAVQPGETRVFEGDLYENTSGEPVVHSPADLPDAWTLISEGVEPVVPDPDDYPEWDSESVDYAAGDLVTYEGGLWEVVTAHTSQAGWFPSDGYLWRRIS